MGCRASALLAIEDAYTAWCLDEAAAVILAGLDRKRKLRPKQTDDNSALIERYFRELEREKHD